jgi:formate hydrogenlyase subunit 3/multisubunit Na+/H+ antiporter MnhD subunit
MLWYGYIYYFLFLTTLFVLLSYYLQVLSIFKFFKFESISSFFTYVICAFLLFMVISLTVLYYIFDYFSQIVTTNLPIGFDSFVISYYTYDFLVETSSLDLNLISVYYFPFIYIFILITILSVIFCLNYNLSELTAFMFYCLIILLAGYLLFFTDSLILFFLAYELLLVPSFFILHNFAKTRRCVEAALLMFFWTQFGALFLIFGFFYIFFVCETSSFDDLSEVTLSQFELNFLFFC